jgi:uncharacterized protein (DUF433 family)
MNVHLRDRIVHNSQVLGGKATIRGTRLSVSLILEKLASGETFEGILADYSHISREDILACIDYEQHAVEEELPLIAAE